MWDKIYLATIPSLNKIAINHYVIFDLRNEEFKVLDPNKGKENKKFYTFNEDTSELAIEIKSYTLDYEIEL